MEKKVLKTNRNTVIKGHMHLENKTILTRNKIALSYKILT